MPTLFASSELASTGIASLGIPSTGLTMLLGAAAIAGLLWRSRRLRGTTLVAPWRWSIVAIAAILVVELLIWLMPSLDHAAGLSPVRYAAYAATLCPIVALLGAKRPQDRGWQLIVLSLWGIMLVPVLSALFFSRGEFTVEIIWSWFLAILVALGLLNSLPTRHWLSGILIAAAQLIAIGDVLPGISAWFQSEAIQPALSGSDRSCIVLGLFALAIVSVHVAVLIRLRQSGGGNVEVQTRLLAMNGLWYDFRNAFGTIWGLRIAERINANALRYDWGVVLRWGGFERTTGDATESPESRDLEPLSADVVDAIESSTRVLLRRFVSSEWIDERLHGEGRLDNDRQPEPVRPL